MTGHEAPSGPATGERPVLLLDVDGVLLVVRSAWGGDEEDIESEPTLHPDAREWLAELAEVFDLAWATTWGDMANRVVAPAVGLPPLPTIDFAMDHRAPTAKLRSVIAWVGDRPCGWLDDDLHEDADTWAAGRAVPTLLVHVDTTTGIERRHVDRLLAFAAELAHGTERGRG